MRAFKLQFAALVAVIAIFTSCISRDQVALIADIDPVKWQSAVEFTIDNQDTVSLREISIFARYQPSQELVDSLPLHIVTIAPDRARVVEQLTLYFDRNSTTQWRRLYREMTYRQGVIWRQSGEYKMMIYPQQPTLGVENIGITLKK